MLDKHIKIVRKINEYFSDFVGDKVDNQRFLALAICGEAGELANNIKKQWRGDFRIDSFEYRQKVLKEIADIQIYLFHLAESFDTNIDACVAIKLPELLARWPEINID